MTPTPSVSAVATPVMLENNNPDSSDMRNLVHNLVTTQSSEIEFLRELAREQKDKLISKKKKIVALK